MEKVEMKQEILDEVLKLKAKYLKLDKITVNYNGSGDSFDSMYCNEDGVNSEDYESLVWILIEMTEANFNNKGSEGIIEIDLKNLTVNIKNYHIVHNVNLSDDITLASMRNDENTSKNNSQQSVLDEIKNAFDEFNKKKEKLCNQLKDNFFFIFEPFFKETDKIKSFSWVQYTPRCNDGDICQFGVHAINSINDNADIDELEWYDWRADYENDNTRKQDLLKEIKQGSLVDINACLVLDKIKKTLSSIPEDFLKELFGDGYEVTVNSDGTINVEEYEHD